MFRTFTSLGTRSESSTSVDRSARRPRRARLGLESLEGRQVPSGVLASSAMVAINVVPTRQHVPATVAYFPSQPVMPATVAHWAG